MLDRFLFVLPVQFSFSYRQTEHKSIHTPYSLVPILFQLTNLTYKIPKSYKIPYCKISQISKVFLFPMRLFEMIMKRCY